MLSVVSLISSSAGYIWPRWFSNSGFLWTINHRFTCMWDWTEMLTVSFPLRAKTYEIHFVWIQKDISENMGTIRNHWNANCLLEDFSGKIMKILSNRNSVILMMSSSEYLFLESECSFAKYVSSYPNTKYLYLWLPFFENEGVSDNTSESVFKFLVRYGCITVEKSKDLMLVTCLKVWDLSCSNNSLEF